MTRSTLIASVAALCMAPTVEAQALRLFLSTDGLSDPGDPQSAIAGSPGLGNPVVDTSGGAQRLYLWGQLSDADHAWLGISLAVQVTGTAQIGAWQIFEASFPGFTRWDLVAQGQLAPGGQLVENIGMASGLGVTGTGALAGTNRAAGDLHHDAVTNGTLLGWFEISGGGDVFVGIGDLGIVRAGNPEPPGDTILLGFGDEADGLQGASFSAFSSQADAVVTTCPADFDGDGMVGFTDLTALLGNWGPCGICAIDLDHDGVVGFTDLTNLLGKWGPCL